MKKCTKCLCIKSLDDYYVHNTKSDKRGSWCKNCVKKQTRGRFEKLRKINQEINYLEGEIFKEFMPHYLISNYGRIFRKEHFSKKYLNSQFLSPAFMFIGYYKISIHKKQYLIHRLVAEQFCENNDKENKKQVNHKDSNRGNNYYKNLEWVTHAGNVRHASRNGRMAIKLTVDKVKEIRILQNQKTIKELADLYGVTTTNIRYIINKKIWKYI